MSEPRESYNKEDIMLLVQEYKGAQQEAEKINWRRVRLAQEATQRFDLKEFAKQVDENYNYLKNLSSLAGKYSEADVSKCALTLKLEHFIVAAKSDKRLEWLKKAGDNNWSAARLGREINPPAPKPVKEEKPLPEPVAEINLPKFNYATSLDNGWKPPTLPNDAFKPFVETFNECYRDGLLFGIPWEDILVLVFGQDEGTKLVMDENYGYRIVHMKVTSLEDGPSQ